ncbi:pentachlorophenol 4-monooxygenase [Grosmannia clavigera kw1407]|uniref:Pentachlorophenol 4-monooxygenase n=1 Tax=Grosmannia clavigera (strain kw1407 / UAMH 11150) TaxID=655863 RepID=F0XBG8_GROCL|nr:pentachlorophenol 4-monooxygenase [Grosmannia clavigera kw1407]EFX04851.1 pentachlorophenol 4-monooxygenase [Grosmannia clavigera kw1407]
MTTETKTGDENYDVCVVGAGPAGLMLAAVLSRLGIKTTVLDERPDRTAVGRADGIQPKTIETFQMMGLGDELLRDGVRVHDICIWRGDDAAALHRVSREVHYPADVLDVLQPYILLCHQGMIEGLLLDDLEDCGGAVQRSHVFESFEAVEGGGSGGDGGERLLKVHSRPSDTVDAPELPVVAADYVVGCDGARSRVRAQIPDTYAQGTPHRSTWGVLDGELDTDFPDIWSKTVVFSEAHGTVLMIPRERNMTRFYIEMKDEGEATTEKTAQSTEASAQDRVMAQARRVLAPFRLDWRTVEWFGHYTVAQRVAARFADPALHVFIGGDASHTHSPKAAQGMNTSVHDSWNLAWKLNLAVRGLATPALLASYEAERKKIAVDLIEFDYEHANQIAAGDAAALANNFRTNIRFIAGVGVDYGLNAINEPVRETPTTTVHKSGDGGLAQPGCTLPPAKATRYIDANPVDVQLDIPILGQFRVYVFVPDVVAPAQAAFVGALSRAVCADGSVLARLSAAAKASYAKQPRPARKKDVFVRPERYTAVSELFTFALMTAADKGSFELAQLPSLFSQSPWTVYLDDVAAMDTQGKSCTGKWLGSLAADEVAVMNVRPDGYVGSIRRWKASEETGGEAARWLDAYYGGFLQA